MGARFSSSRRPGRAAPAPAPPRGDLVASMQRSASSVGDAFTEAVASASRSVGAFGLEREIASYESKIRARKRQFGVEAYGPLRTTDRQALALAFNAARNDISALQAVIDRKRAALAALRDSATPQPARANGGDAADALARALDVPRATAADALRRTNGDRDAAAAMILEQQQRQPAPPVEAEVLSWDNPIEATLVEESRPRRSLSKRISDRMRGRL